MEKFPKGLQIINKLRYVFVLVAIGIGLSFYNYGESSTKKDKVIMDLVYRVLNSTHFSPATIDDAFSAKVYTNFLEDIDFSKRFFLQSDLDLLNGHKLEIDDQIKQADLAFFEEAYKVYQERLKQSKTYAFAVLDKPFDFTQEESINTDDEERAYAESQEELQERWRKYLKFRTLNRLEEMVEDNAKDAEGLIR